MIENHPHTTPQRDNALAKVKTPATGLLIVSGISILLSAILATMLLFAGAEEGFGRYASLISLLAFTWPLAILMTNAVSAYSALNILRLQSYQLSKFGVIIALTPLAGPCFILGFPFAIRLIAVMTEDDVQSQFTRQ